MARYCPRCTPRRALEGAVLKGLEVQLCQGCRGILMTRDDLETAIGIAASRAPGGRNARSYFDRLGRAAKFVDGNPSIRCPACRYNMYDVRSNGIIIDFCMNCQAVWFDEGELKGTLTVARERGSFDVIPDSYEENDAASLICYMLDIVGE